MRKKIISNKSASILAKIKNIAVAQKVNVNQMQIYYIIGRFLHRLYSSRHKDNFILKGAILLRTYSIPIGRPTKDIDFLVKGIENSKEEIRKILQDILAEDSTNIDGIMFDCDTIKIKDIDEKANYSGFEISLKARIGKAELTLRLDMAFDDVVYPQPKKRQYPSLLSDSSFEVTGYRIETVIAEKLESIIDLGINNSRLKDFFDILYLSSYERFKGKILREAIVRTFYHRKTMPTLDISSFSVEFIKDNQRRWKELLDNSNTDKISDDFKSAISAIKKFLIPVLDSVVSNSTFNLNWSSKKRQWSCPPSPSQQQNQQPSE